MEHGYLEDMILNKGTRNGGITYRRFIVRKSRNHWRGGWKIDGRVETLYRAI